MIVTSSSSNLPQSLQYSISITQVIGTSFVRVNTKIITASSGASTRCLPSKRSQQPAPHSAIINMPYALTPRTMALSSGSAVFVCRIILHILLLQRGRQLFLSQLYPPPRPARQHALILHPYRFSPGMHNSKQSSI